LENDLADALSSGNLVKNLVDYYGPNEALKAVARIGGYIDVPPTIQEFMDESYYMKDLVDLFPTWREYLLHIFPNPFYCKYREIAVSGAIGTGKTFFCSMGTLYDTAKLLHLRDPHRQFGLNIAKPIVLACINTTKNAAQATTFQNLITWVNQSPFFINQQARVLHLDKRKKRDLLPHRISITNASRGRDVLGQDVFSAILSELNFQGEVVKDQAVQNYTQVLHRLETRFERGGGLMTPGRLWLDSSKSDETGWLENHMKVLKTDPDHSLIISKAVWEVLERAGKREYQKERFLVFVGDQTRDPFIIEGPGASLNIPEQLIIKVPMDYYPHFQRNLIGSIQNIAGVSTWGSNLFFTHEALVRASLRQDLINHRREIIELDFDDDYDQLINYIDVANLPKDVPYCIHFDIGIKRDRTGIAMTRCIGEIQVERQNDLLQNLMTRDMIYQTPLMMAVVAKPGKEVPLSKLRNLVINLLEAGVMIAGVSADGYQSTELIQLAKRAGLVGEVISVDRTRDPYDHFKDAVYEKRWSGSQHSILLTEMLNLRDEGKKIDHPLDEGGALTVDSPSKDIADAVAGSLWHCKELNSGNKAGQAFSKYAESMKVARLQTKAIDQYNKMQIKETSFTDQLRLKRGRRL